MLTLIRCGLAAALSLLAFPALANLGGPCAPIDNVKSILKKNGQVMLGFGEAPADDGGSFVTFLAVNPETGSWVLLFNSQDGESLCVAAVGEGWTPVDPPLAGENT